MEDEEMTPYSAESEPMAEDSKEETGGEGAEEPRFERRWSKRSGARLTQETPDLGGEADLSAQLEKERSRADDLYDRLQRSMADLSNYRKRAESDREEMSKFATMVLVAELLPVLDNFDRALAAIPRELERFTWLQGIVLIERHLRAILERQGLEAIDAVAKPFNPSLHEAMVEEETSEAEPGVIIGDLQTGYTMHGKVLRPTLAKVAKAPQPDTDAEAKSQETSQGVDTEVLQPAEPTHE